MFIYSSNDRCDIASMIENDEVVYLLPSQIELLDAILEQLPPKSRQTILEKAQGEVWADEYVELKNARLEKAIEEARELSVPDAFVPGKIPVDSLKSRAYDTLCENFIEDYKWDSFNDGSLTFDYLVDVICENRVSKIKGKDFESDSDFLEFREPLSEKCRMAIWDCHKLLKERAFTKEMTKFHQALYAEDWDVEYESEALEYDTTLKKVSSLAIECSQFSGHFEEAVNKSIIAYYEKFKTCSFSNVFVARAHKLFSMLDIDATIADIRWAVDNPKIPDDFQLCNPSIRRDLLYLGFKTMGELMTEEGKKKLAKHEYLDTTIKDNLRYLFG